MQHSWSFDRWKRQLKGRWEELRVRWEELKGRQLFRRKGRTEIDRQLANLEFDTQIDCHYLQWIGSFDRSWLNFYYPYNQLNSQSLGYFRILGQLQVQCSSPQASTPAANQPHTTPVSHLRPGLTQAGQSRADSLCTSKGLQMFDQQKYFNYFDYETLYKDFCFKKPLVFSFAAATPSTTCHFEHELLFKNSKCVLEDKIRIQRSLGPNGRLRLASALGSFHLLYSHNLPRLPGQTQAATASQTPKEPVQDFQQIRGYAASYSDRKLQNASMQLGFQRSTAQTHVNANITNFIYKHKNEYFLYAKLLYMSERFKMGLLTIFDLGSHNLQTNDLVLEFRPTPTHQLFLRGEVFSLRNYSLNYKSPRGYFDVLACNYICRPSQSLTMMAELKYDIEADRLHKLESLIEKKFDNMKLKLCLNHFWDITMQIGVPFSVGKSSKLDFGLLLSDVFKSRKISYGFKIDVNC